MPKTLDLCALSDIPEDEPLQVFPEGMDPLAVCQVGETVYVVDDMCTHGMASLSEGWVEDGLLYCPFHSGAFDPATGKAAVAPCTIDIRTYPVTVENDRVLIEV
ncbi:MAG: non-heme iron oxygenase ferredoxin subunit [Pseudomonadota bacterium]